MFSSGTKLTTLGAGIVVLVFVMLFAIVITSTGATFGVLMTLFSFANCLGDIVLCIIPFFLRKKYPHACRHAGFTMPLWVLYAMSVFAIVVAAYLSYSALLTLGATVWLLLAIFALQDSFGTACNVTGDGALAMMMEGIFNRNRQLDDRFGTGE